MHSIALGYPVAFGNGGEDWFGGGHRSCRSWSGEEAGVDTRGAGSGRYGVGGLKLF